MGYSSIMSAGVSLWFNMFGKHQIKVQNMIPY